MVNKKFEPKISVIMSTFNSENNIKDSVQSIVNQNFKDFEFLIVDDCSSDGTYNVLKEFEFKDKRIKVFKNDTNIGLTKSLNKLLKHSKGKYIARQDDDDLSFENRFSLQYDLLENSQYRICTSRAKILNTNTLRPRLAHIFPQKLTIKYKNPFIHGTLMIEKKLFEDIGFYNEDFYLAQDYKLFFDLISKGYKVKQIKEPLYTLNTVNNLSSNFKKDQRIYANFVRHGLKPNL